MVELNTTTFVSAAVPKEINLTDPLNCKSPPDPETIIDSAPYFPMVTLLSANASITGRPAIVFTEYKESDKSSDMENSVPLFPLTVNMSVLPVEPDPNNVSDPDASCIKVCLKFAELVKLIILDPGVIIISAMFYLYSLLGIGCVHSGVASNSNIS